MKKLLTVIALMLMNPAIATNVPFSATVATSCTLNVNNGGTMAVDPVNPATMGTSVSSGIPASVSVNYLGAPTITITAPTAFATSPTIAFSPTFTSAASSAILGNLTFTSGVATGTYSSNSNDTLTLGLTVTGAPFPIGTYSAIVVVTCS